MADETSRCRPESLEEKELIDRADAGGEKKRAISAGRDRCVWRILLNVSVLEVYGACFSQVRDPGKTSCGPNVHLFRSGIETVRQRRRYRNGQSATIGCSETTIPLTGVSARSTARR